MSNWYDNPQITAEIATLTKDIIFYQVEDIQAEFLLRILSPTMDTSSGDASNVQTKAPSTRSQVAHKLDAKDYITANNIVITIPKYIVYEFYDPFLQRNLIPKETQFIVSSIGAELEVDKIRITGYYKMGEIKNDY